MVSVSGDGEKQARKREVAKAYENAKKRAESQPSGARMIGTLLTLRLTC
jgi:hypothetical protein